LNRNALRTDAVRPNYTLYTGTQTNTQR